MAEVWLRIEILADDDAPFVAMFEPAGMTYHLGAGECMFADVSKPVVRELRVVNWNGGISIWAPGPVITRNAQGDELHQLN